MNKLWAAAAVGAALVLSAGAASAQMMLPPAQQGVAYSAPLMPPPGYMSWDHTAATPPGGLSISGSTISGTPTVPGTHDFTVDVTGTIMSICMMPGPPPTFTPMPMPCPQAASTVQTYRVEVAASAAAIPTMTEWAMIVLGVMLAGAAAMMIQRRRAA